jgi:hypothetical protein
LIWVSGKAGWYEIVPSAAYLQIYNKMCEAATLYYHIMDIYEDETLKKSKKGKRGGAIAELSPVFHRVGFPNYLPAFTADSNSLVCRPDW